jgi:pimeloyl-ACP methyl ester carboxylesterase
VNLKDSIEFHFVETNGIRLHVAQAGPAKGRLVILLHGFPEFWYGWRRQIPFLAEHGFRVWAPDQRGYNLSDKPPRVRDYSLDELAGDVVGLIEAAGCSSAVLVGHDWGAAVAWWVATAFPERVERLAILNVPHPLVMRRHVRRSFRQRLRSWYILFFQLPWLPEATARWGNWRGVVRAMQSSSRPGTFSDEDWEQYRTAWSQPGAYRAMIHWYRAALRAAPKLPKELRIAPPTLMIWGARDKFLGREMAQPSIDLCEDGRLVFLEEATHWVQHEEAQQVNELILEHIAT